MVPNNTHTREALHPHTAPLWQSESEMMAANHWVAAIGHIEKETSFTRNAVPLLRVQKINQYMWDSKICMNQYE